MAIRLLTDATGKRIAAAMEGIAGADNSAGIKFPHLGNIGFQTISLFASDHAHYSSTEIKAIPFASTDPTYSPLLNFLNGLTVLSNYDRADEGRFAFLSYDFMKYLLFEASRFNQNGIVKTTNGIITRIDNCSVREVGNEHLPRDFSFLILGADLVKGLIELEAAGKLDDADELTALLETYPDSMYLHLGNPVLHVLDVSVTPYDTNKILVQEHAIRNTGTEKFYFLAADSITNLPDVSYGTAIDPTSGGWSWAIELFNPSIINQALSYVDEGTVIDLSKLARGTGSGGISTLCDSTITYHDLKYMRIVQVLRSMKPLACRDLHFEAI